MYAEANDAKQSDLAKPLVENEHKTQCKDIVSSTTYLQCFCIQTHISTLNITCFVW